MFTCLDIECTYQGRFGADDSDASPYNPLNKLVSVGYKTSTGEEDYLVFYHDENPRATIPENVKKLQDILNRSRLVIGHNLKFDMSWLFEAGFTYSGRYYDTMIFEYVNAMGLKTSISLADTLQRYKLPNKLDILHKYCGEEGLNVHQVPLVALKEYGIADVDATYALYKLQVEALRSKPEVAAMKPAIKLMNDFLEVLIDVERNGIKIDLAALDAVELEFKQRHTELEAKLKRMVAEVMGHTPINLNSPEQVSWIIHSIRVKDKEHWAKIFNLGTEIRNGVSKVKYITRYDDTEFKHILRTQTEPVYRTEAQQCHACGGRGYIQKYNKDGSPSKRLNVCHTCNKTGIIYKNLDTVAGYRLKPISYEYASAGGFSTSKEVLEELLLTDLPVATREFVEALKEYNAISTYLTSFVEGIRKNVRAGTNLLHTNFNQCITSTGRLSSTRPNLQNQPRESTFPIRSVFISRFSNGKLLNADFKQLEFRVAAFLAQDKVAIADILNNVDVHKQTAIAIKGSTDITKEERQDAKKSTFRPLYGGTSGTAAQKKYFEFFFDHYRGIFEWHNKLMEEAVTTRRIITPSGRVYAFPWCERRRNGSVSFHTQIKNYPVQGFATGDILPVTMVEIYRLMKRHNVQSKLVLTVHDSIVADVKDGEMDVMVKIFREGFAITIQALKERFNIDFNLPLDMDLEAGYNLLNKEGIHA